MAILRQGGYEGDSLPLLDDSIPSANIEGTQPVTTLEEIRFEQKYADQGKITPAQEAVNADLNFQILEKSSAMKK